MKLSTLLIAGTMLAGLAGVSAPAFASVCPNAINGACDLVFTFNADGSITTSGAGGSSIGGEDALIGVVNNTTHVITSFGLTGSNIFGFDVDGIGTSGALYGPVGTNPDTSTYGGPNGFFTIVDHNTGVVNFANGGIAAGGSDYFSLEQAVSLTAPPIITPTPEPASMLLLGAGLAGLGLIRRRKA